MKDQYTEESKLQKDEECQIPPFTCSHFRGNSRRGTRSQTSHSLRTTYLLVHVDIQTHRKEPQYITRFRLYQGILVERGRVSVGRKRLKERNASRDTMA